MYWKVNPDGTKKLLFLRLQVGGRIICGACLRIRFSLMHLFLRYLGLCEGDGRGTV